MAQDPSQHPTWCVDHFYPTDPYDTMIHLSAPIAWGREGSYVRVEDDGRGTRIYVSVRLDNSEYCRDFDLSPDASRLLATSLLDAANRAQGLD